MSEGSHVNFNEDNMMSEEPDGAANDAVEEKHMTLGGGEFGDPDVTLGFDEKPKLKINSGALLIIFVAAVAAIGLFSMRTLTRASAEFGPPPEVEQSIDLFLGVVLENQGKIGGNTKEGVLEVLNESYASRQVPLEEVQRNPFILFEPVAIQSPVAEPAGPVDPLAAHRRARLADFEKAAGNLRVGMILMGSQPMANVNNRVVRLNESVAVNGVEFRIVDITPGRVEFLAEDSEIGVKYEYAVQLRKE